MSEKKRLLVVDNEVDICNFVRLFFEQRGFEVSTAYDGDEAVQVATQLKPEVILLDLVMRHANDGFETLPKLRKIVPNARILMITGIDDEASALRGKALGADDYITKPLILDYLESTVIKKVQA